VLNMVVHWRKWDDVESECTYCDFIV